MCVGLTFKIRGVNFRSPKFASFGCGNCEECRAVYKSAWSFRLMAELEPLVAKNWKMCFYTLTYDDEHLPLLPIEAFKDPDRDYWINKEAGISRGIPCFSKDNIEAFTNHMRFWFFQHGLTDIKYFIASEFGSNTQRPHHHGIYCVPPDFDTKALFDEIHSFWERFGFVFPKDYFGGFDSQGYEHKPFVVNSPLAAMRYCAKYVTKDIYYNEFLNLEGLGIGSFRIKERAFKRCMQFHVQTRGLGSCYLETLKTDEDKLKALNEGVFFNGDDKPRNLPQYLKNKLLFVNFYKKVGKIAPKRLVRRLPSAFFDEYREQIYNRKKKYAFDFFARLRDSAEWVARGVSPENTLRGLGFLNLVNSYLPRGMSLEDYYVGYYGQLVERTALPVDDSSFSDFWFLRFDDSERLNPLSWRPSTKLERERLEQAFNSLNMVFQYWSSVRPCRSAQQRISDRLVDYFGHCA
jgi:hypothetical protein